MSDNSPSALQDASSESISESTENLENTQSETPDEESNKIPPAKSEVQKALKRKLMLKVDGEEFEEEFDPNDDEYLRRQFQLAKVSQKRMKDYSQLQKEVQEAFDLLKKNPRKFLSDPNIGVDIKNLARQVIEEEVEKSKKSPEQLEKEQLMRELQDLKDQRENEQKSLKQKEMEVMQERYYQEYDNKISAALETAQLPKSPYVVNKIGQYLYDAAKMGYKIDVEDVVPIVQEEIQQDIKEMFGAMPDEVLDSLLGNDVYNRMRKRRVSKAKPPAPLNSSVKDTSSGKKVEQKEEKRMSIKQFLGV